MFPTLRPALTVISSDSLKGDIDSLVGSLGELGLPTWKIDSGKSVACLQKLELIARDGSGPGGGPLQGEARALNNVLMKFVELPLAPTNPSFPTALFHCCFVFPKREERSLMFSKSLATAASPLGVRLYRPDERAKSAESKLAGLVREWLEQLSSGGFHGETARTSRPIIRACDVPEMPGFTRQCGYEFIFEDFSEVSLSWVELFFLLRRELPKNRRVSLHFWNP